MAKTPAEKVARPTNGKTYTVREREYDLNSKAGVGMLFKVFGMVLGITAAVLTAYYTAEAGQRERIVTVETQQGNLSGRQNESEKAFANALDRLSETLVDQRDVIQKTRESLIRVDTNQQNLQKQTGELAEQVKALAEKVHRLEKP